MAHAGVFRKYHKTLSKLYPESEIAAITQGIGNTFTEGVFRSIYSPIKLEILSFSNIYETYQRKPWALLAKDCLYFGNIKKVLNSSRAEYFFQKCIETDRSVGRGIPKTC